MAENKKPIWKRLKEEFKGLLLLLILFIVTFFIILFFYADPFDRSMFFIKAKRWWYTITSLLKLRF